MERQSCLSADAAILFEDALLSTWLFCAPIVAFLQRREVQHMQKKFEQVFLLFNNDLFF
jgi:hypothetical protein